MMSCDTEFWRAILDSLTAHVAILDETGTIIAVNQAWRRFATENDQPDPNACLGVNYLAVCENAVKDESNAVAIANGIRAVLDGRRKEFSTPYPCHSPKKQRWFMLRVTRFDGPPPARLVIAHENITAPKAAQMRASRYAREVEEANRMLVVQASELAQAKALEADRNRILELIARNEIPETVLTEVALLVERYHPDVCCAVIVRRQNSFVVTATSKMPAERMTILSRDAAMMLASRDQERPSDLLRLNDVLRGGSAAVANLFLSIPINGEINQPPACLAISSTPGNRRPDHSAVFEMAASIASVAIQHTSLYERLSFQSHHDSLTGVPNRILFRERLKQAVAVSKRQNTCFGLLLLDLDQFKHVNDVYGHRAGDALLRHATRKLVALAPLAATVSRLGGDEFGLLLSDCPSAESAQLAANDICAIFADPFPFLEHQLHVTCSIGVSLFPHDASEAADLFQNAEAALFEAKRSGTGSYRLYDKNVGTALEGEVEIERRLGNAIRDEELQLWFQPQVNARRDIVGVEALMRWTSGVLGVVSPARFIPIAERTGSILALGAWALTEACRCWKRWQAAGHEPIHIAVNVSTVQLCHGNLASTVEQIIRETGMVASYLELEVTESAMMDNMSEAILELERLHSLGVRLSIDDFGTGYSSLSYLQRLPVDSVKIDRSFVRDLTETTDDAISVVQAIITLAHNLKLTVVAEGVETEPQMTILTNLKCDLIQGYLLYEPLSANTLQCILDSGGLTTFLDA